MALERVAKPTGAAGLECEFPGRLERAMTQSVGGGDSEECSRVENAAVSLAKMWSEAAATGQSPKNTLEGGPTSAWNNRAQFYTASVS